MSQNIIFHHSKNNNDKKIIAKSKMIHTSTSKTKNRAIEPCNQEKFIRVHGKKYYEGDYVPDCWRGIADDGNNHLIGEASIECIKRDSVILRGIDFEGYAGKYITIKVDLDEID